MKPRLILIMMVVPLAALMLGLWIGRQAGPPARTVDETVIVERVRQIAKLATVECCFSDILSFEEESPWPDIFQKDKKALVIARARVLAGFDLEAPAFTAGMTECTYDRALELHFPEPDIIATDPTYKFHDLQGALTAEQHEWLLSRTRSTIIRAARKSGIMDDAKTNLKELLAAALPDIPIILAIGDDSPRPLRTRTKGS